MRVPSGARTKRVSAAVGHVLPTIGAPPRRRKSRRCSIALISSEFSPDVDVRILPMTPHRPLPSPRALARAPRAAPDAPPALVAVGTMNFGARTPAPEAARIVARALERGRALLRHGQLVRGRRGRAHPRTALRGRRAEVGIATKVGLARVRGKPEGLSGAQVVRAVEDEPEAARARTTWTCSTCTRRTPPRRSRRRWRRVRGLLRAGQGATLGRVQLRGLAAPGAAARCATRAACRRPALSQVLYNLLVRQLEVEYLPFTRRHPLHTTVYNPLAGGLLSGRYTPGAAIPVGLALRREPLLPAPLLVRARSSSWPSACAPWPQDSGPRRCWSWRTRGSRGGRAWTRSWWGPADGGAPGRGAGRRAARGCRRRCSAQVDERAPRLPGHGRQLREVSMLRVDAGDASTSTGPLAHYAEHGYARLGTRAGRRGPGVAARARGRPDARPGELPGLLLPDGRDHRAATRTRRWGSAGRARRSTTASWRSWRRTRASSRGWRTRSSSASSGRASPGTSCSTAPSSSTRASGRQQPALAPGRRASCGA